ncbi:hypothetical protein [Streptomyces sp. NBC_00454]
MVVAPGYAPYAVIVFLLAATAPTALHAVLRAIRSILGPRTHPRTAPRVR